MKLRLYVFGSFLLICYGIVPGSFLTAQDTVRVTVSAASQGGAPVTTLLSNDFSVTDQGKPRTLTSFAGPDTKSLPPMKLQPNEYSNIPDIQIGSGAIFVVFDTIHTRYIDERDERAQVLKFLLRAAQAKHAVTLAILSDKGLTVYHDYRSGSDLLLAAMIKASLGGAKGLTPPPGLNDADVAAEMARLVAFSKGDKSNPAPEGILLRSNLDVVLTMFQDIGASAAGLHGRKLLVWVTNAVPFDIDPKSMQFKSPQVSSHGVAVAGTAVGGSKDQLTTAEIKRIAPIWRQSMRSLFDGGVAVYPVEVRGSGSSATNTLSQIAMKTLAQLTGGSAFFGSNDPFPDLLNISARNTAGYILGFTPDSAANSDFQRLEVTANRANIEVAHPAGYFPFESTYKSRAGSEVALALQSPLEYTGVLFRITVAGFEEGSAGKKKVNLVISLPGDEGIVNETTGSVDVSLVANALNSAGQKVGTMNEGAGGKFQPDQVAQIKEMGFQLKRSFEVAPGECTVHFVIRDNQTGRTGDIIFPMTVK